MRVQLVEFELENPKKERKCKSERSWVDDLGASEVPALKNKTRVGEATKKENETQRKRSVHVINKFFVCDT